MSREQLIYDGARALHFHQQSSDFIQSSESPQRIRTYRHWTPYGLMTYDSNTHILHSPLRPADDQDIWVRPIAGFLLELFMQHPEKVHTLQEIKEKMEQRTRRPWKEQYMTDVLNELRKAAGEPANTQHKRVRSKIVHRIPTRGITLVDPNAAMSVNSYHHSTPFGDLVFDPERLTVISPHVNNGEQPIHVTPVQGKILGALMQNPTRVLPSRELFKAIWGDLPYKPDPIDVSDRVPVEINCLRNCLGEGYLTAKGKGALLIFTARDGYTLLSPKAALAVENELCYQHTTAFGEICYNHEMLVVSSPFINKGKSPVHLSPQEGNIMLCFLTRIGNRVLFDEFRTFSHEYIRMYVSYLRKKLGDSDFRLIVTIPGGFQLTSLSA